MKDKVVMETRNRKMRNREMMGRESKGHSKRKGDGGPRGEGQRDEG